MSLTRKQFDILVALAEAGQPRGESGAEGKKQLHRGQSSAEQAQPLSQRALAEKTGHSLGTVNNAVKELTQAGFISCGGAASDPAGSAVSSASGCAITPAGLSALEPFRARRAVFIAAGFGTRLVPITLNTPKPLVRVRGVRIIDTLIDACLAAGIEEIWVVRGYLAEQFDQLLYKYPMIRFIENPDYNEANNISSALAARDLMQNAYVLESDLLLRNSAIITRYHYQSDVLGIWKERTDDWCFETDRDRFVTCEKVGGLDCYQMVGIYYWNAEDGARLSGHLTEAWNSPGGRERYWETVPNQAYRGQYRIEVRPCTDEDIVEIDTFRELRALDHAYNI